MERTWDESLLERPVQTSGEEARVAQLHEVELAFSIHLHRKMPSEVSKSSPYWSRNTSEALLEHVPYLLLMVASADFRCIHNNKKEFNSASQDDPLPAMIQSTLIQQAQFDLHSHLIFSDVGLLGECLCLRTQRLNAALDRWTAGRQWSIALHAHICRMPIMIQQ